MEVRSFKFVPYILANRELGNVFPGATLPYGEFLYNPTPERSLLTIVKEWPKLLQIQILVPTKG